MLWWESRGCVTSQGVKMRGMKVCAQNQAVSFIGGVRHCVEEKHSR